jgi:hypothetical protein
MKLGALDISTVKLGTNQVQAVYQGVDLVWQNAPVATAATGVGTTSFTANWNAYSGATYYLLDVSESSDFSTFVYENQIVLAPNTSYVVIGLNSNTTYYYRVRASDESPYISATGGTVTTDGDFKIHTFLSSGTFVVLNSPNGETAEVLVVAGGGGGGGYSGGGGGAGGLIYNASKSIAVNNYTITVGSGGARPTSNTGGNTNGNNSVFDSLTAIGGGRGGVQNSDNGKDGGSGGGGAGTSTANGGVGTSGQGNNGGGGTGNITAGGGGGGAGFNGANATGSNFGGVGGDGLSYLISGTSQYYAGGGGGSGSSGQGLGGLGGGGNGNKDGGPTGTSGTANTGGGGGGAYIPDGSFGNGGSGIVIIRYKFQ